MRFDPDNYLNFFGSNVCAACGVKVENTNKEEITVLCEKCKAKKCPTCGVEWYKYFSMVCPNCKRCYHWIAFGSDYRCKCKKKWYWWGIGWVDRDEYGRAIFPKDVTVA